MQVGNQEYINRCRIFLCQLQDETDLKTVYQQFQNLKQNQPYPQPHLLYLKEVFQLSDIQLFLMLYAYTYEIDSEISGYVWQNTKARYLSLGIILSLYSKIEKLSLLDFSACSLVIDQGILFYRSDSSYSFMREIRLHRFVFYYLNSGCLSETDILKIHDPSFYTFVSVYAEEKMRLLYFMQHGMSCCICGDLHTGRKSLVMQCAKELQMFVYRFSIQDWIRVSKAEQDEVLASLIFFHNLQTGILIIEDAEAEYTVQLSYIKKKVEKYEMQLIAVLLDEKGQSYPTIIIPPYLTYIDMQIMGRALWGKDWTLSQLHLTPYELTQLKNKCPDGKAILSVIDQEKQNFTSPYYKILQTTQGLDDWLGEGELVSQLTDLVFYIRHKEEADTFLQCDVRGKGCTVLFHGPSGTGKTLAAKMIGKETHLSVWQINTAMVLDKYIGESEKHLQEIFQQARKQNCILLFDEADVLFARRTVIASSNDRYANTSTAYLLQELEAYTGIVFMTSNLLTNFDDAFLRRIRFILHFPSPNDEVKKEKWKQCFQNIILEDEIDFDAFAKHFRLSLSSIENVYENAICYWLQEGSLGLKKEHLFKALKQEYQKRMETLPAVLNEMEQNNQYGEK